MAIVLWGTRCEVLLMVLLVRRCKVLRANRLPRYKSKYGRLSCYTGDLAFSTFFIGFFPKEFPQKSRIRSVSSEDCLPVGTCTGILTAVRSS